MARAAYPETPPDRSGTRAGRPVSFPYLALHRKEFTWPRLLPNTPVSSYLTISPITLSGWYILCCTCRRTLNAHARTLSGSLPYGVRTFLFRVSKSDHPTRFIARFEKYNKIC